MSNVVFAARPENVQVYLRQFSGLLQIQLRLGSGLVNLS